MKRQHQAADADNDEDWLDAFGDDDLLDLEDDHMHIEEGTSEQEEKPLDRTERVEDDNNRVRALASYILPEKTSLKKFLVNQLGGNRVSAQQYYSIKNNSKVPRPAQVFRSAPQAVTLKDAD